MLAWAAPQAPSTTCSAPTSSGSCALVRELGLREATAPPRRARTTSSRCDCEDGNAFTPEDLAGKTTVLVFNPFAFSPVCTDQFNLYEEVLDEFKAHGATLYGVSCDATWSQKAFREKLGVTIEQLSDFEPKGEGVPRVRGLPPRRVSAACPGDHRPGRRGQMGLRGSRWPTELPVARQPDLRRSGCRRHWLYLQLGS